MSTRLKLHLALTLVELAAVDAPLAQALLAELTKRDVKFDAQTPIGSIPMVRQLIEESRLADVVKLANVSPTAADALTPLLSPEAIDRSSRIRVTARRTTAMTRDRARA